METIEYRSMNKSGWSRGPWDDEPDKMQWPDQVTGLPCLIVRNGSGNLCGYVGVPVGHPAHGKDYGDLDVSVHGGLTFAHHCAPQTRETWEQWRSRALARKDEAREYPRGDAATLLREHAAEVESFEAWQRYVEASQICHVPGPGEPDGVWWLGFDCAHAGDLTPAYERISFIDGKYRNVDYVRAEIADLARQLEAMA